MITLEQPQTDTITKKPNFHEDAKILVGIPYASDSLPVPFVRSLVNLDLTNAHLNFVAHTITSAARNLIVQKALREEFTHVLFIDSDMTFTPDIIRRLWANQVPIVSGVYFTRRDQRLIAYNYDEELERCYQLSVLDWVSDLLPVDCLGTGCLMVNCEVFKKLPAPWFYYGPKLSNVPLCATEEALIAKHASETSYLYDASLGYQHGEDFQFCINAKKAGFQPMLDSTVHCGHCGVMEIHEAFISTPRTGRHNG